MPLLYLTNAVLWPTGVLYQSLFLFQNAVYALCYVGYRLERSGRPNLYLMLPYYFALINVAAGHAFVKFLFGRKQIIWTPRAG